MWETYKIRGELQVIKRTFTRTLLSDFLRKYASESLVSIRPLCSGDDASSRVFELRISFFPSSKNPLREEDREGISTLKERSKVLSKSSEARNSLLQKFSNLFGLQCSSQPEKHLEGG